MKVQNMEKMKERKMRTGGHGRRLAFGGEFDKGAVTCLLHLKTFFQTDFKELMFE